MNFTSSADGIKRIGEENYDEQVQPFRLDVEGEAEETKLRRAYLTHPDRLLTEVTKLDGSKSLETLKGFVFPASEIASILNNSEHIITSVFIEFCNLKEVKGIDKFSLMLTGLDVNDNRIRFENGESRVFEFAQSCPERCPR